MPNPVTLTVVGLGSVEPDAINTHAGSVTHIPRRAGWATKVDETIHDRSIRTDDGWKLILGRGLDIFQKGSGSQFDLGSRRQEFRQVFAFGITYIREQKGAR